MACFAASPSSAAKANVSPMSAAARLRPTSTKTSAVPTVQHLRGRFATSLVDSRRVDCRRSRTRFGGAALTASASASSSSSSSDDDGNGNGNDGAMVFEYTQLELDTKLGISLHDITTQINECIAKAGVKNGYVNVLSRHTTTVG